jgi:hypothetical protein
MGANTGLARIIPVSRPLLRLPPVLVNGPTHLGNDAIPCIRLSLYFPDSAIPEQEKERNEQDGDRDDLQRIDLKDTVQDDLPQSRDDAHLNHDIDRNPVFPEVDDEQAVNLDQDENIDQFSGNGSEIKGLDNTEQEHGNRFDHQDEENNTNPDDDNILDIFQQPAEYLMDSGV